ncbi:glycosyltransferase [Sulfurovum sp. zt1-1]|uniref:Glycosyltransferase n=1 Tax=Sulfurovum zhangzhouensis TaxID=3019067 RepID=A0ABT7R0E7_9BACT|nr:glycosyltransferase [Sulfurovum zhangzhouensis]MDM5272545.1 glycosyltransferase [Sulfurovum zhangzhouensis]
MKYAPIVLFTYNRLDELKQTIEALKNNKLASESELYIYSDAAKDKTDEQKVLKVRSYLKTIEGFNHLQVIERDENFGLARSVIEGVNEILERHGKVIVLEDDLITSKNFLCYMNSALEFYQDEEKVFSISGYTMPLKSLKKYDNDTYASVRPSSWGWATWNDRWKGIDWDIRDYESFIHDKKAIKDFNLGGADLSRMLKHYKQKKNNSWAIRWAYAMFKANKFCIYPKISKVQNIGFGLDATHCKGINIYSSPLDQTDSCDFKFINKIILDKQIADSFKYQFSYMNKFIKKISNKIHSFLG